MKKIISILLLVALSMGLVFAGGGGESEKTITVLVEGGSPANAVVESTKAEFESLTGYEVIIDAVPYSGIYDKVMAGIGSGRAQHDLICIDVLWFAAMKPGLVDLNTIVTDDVKNDSMPGLLDGATIDGSLLGYPLWTNSQLLIYRADLFADEANKSAFRKEYGYELNPPTNWKEYAEIAEFFTTDDMYGTALHGLGPHAPTQFLNFASQAGASPLVLNEDLTSSNMNTKAYVDALTYMQKMQEDGIIPPDTLAIGADECNQLFLNGKIAMQLNWAHLYATSYAQLGDKVGVAPNIAGDAGVGAISGPWYMSVLKDSEKQEVATEYMNFMFDNNREFLDAGLKVSARVSDFEEFGAMPEYAHLNAMIETLGGEMSQNRPNTPKWAQIEEVIIATVQNSIAGNDPQAEVDKAKVQIDEILE